jgi:hypothetical protein
VIRPGWFGVARAVLRRPTLWATAARQGKRLARAQWWRRPPFLPIPAPAWLRFRFETQYGAEGGFDPHDVVVWLAWARATDRRNRALGNRVRDARQSRRRARQH